MSFKKYSRRYHSKRASKGFKQLMDRKFKYNFARSMPRVQAYSKRRYG